MEEQNIQYNEVTKAMLLQYYRLTGEHKKAIAYLQQVNDAALTPYLFSIGIFTLIFFKEFKHDIILQVYQWLSAVTRLFFC